MAVTGADLNEESAFSTAGDLIVSVEKSRIYLANLLPPGALLPMDAPVSLDFGYLIDRMDVEPRAPVARRNGRGPEPSLRRLLEGAEKGATVESGLAQAIALSSYAAELLALFVRSDRQTLAAFLRTWTPV